MKIFLLFLSLSASVLASLNATEIAEDLPSCALKCSVALLTAANCSLLDSAPCLCTIDSIALQASLSKCVQQNCTFPEQLKAARVQTETCAGYPQQSRSEYVRTISITFVAITFPFLIMRFVSRYLVSQQMCADDWAAVVATVFLTISAGLQVTSVERGFGKHYWNVNPADAASLPKIFYALQTIYITIQTMARISLLLLYIRLFPPPKFRLLCNLMIGFVAIQGAVFIIVDIFQCSPISAAWDMSIHGKCIDLAAAGYAIAALSILEDVIILILPLPMLYTLNTSLAKRVGLMAMFAVGGFACVTSMIRIKYMSDFSDDDFDPTWNDVDVMLWSVIEVDIALICACLPSIRPLITRIIPNLFKGTEKSLPSRNANVMEMNNRLHRWNPMGNVDSAGESKVRLNQESAGVVASPRLKPERLRLGERIV